MPLGKPLPTGTFVNVATPEPSVESVCDAMLHAPPPSVTGTPEPTLCPAAVTATFSVASVGLVRVTVLLVVDPVETGGRCRPRLPEAGAGRDRVAGAGRDVREGQFPAESVVAETEMSFGPSVSSTGVQGAFVPSCCALTASDPIGQPWNTSVNVSLVLLG